ncbi:hypothetical protein V3H18_15135 [Methylocystis sp. 9N]|uniref:DUF2946 domain-containing protein n=1 Tax=Methylocystis borbori TaxID=3118750 RepID=A0ABU7XKF4_9HYPH
MRTARLALALALVVALQTSLQTRIAHESTALQTAVHVEPDCGERGPVDIADAGSHPVSHAGHFCGHCLPCLETSAAIDAPFDSHVAPPRVVESAFVPQNAVARPRAAGRAAHSARAPPLFS